MLSYDILSNPGCNPALGPNKGLFTIENGIASEAQDPVSTQGVFMQDYLASAFILEGAQTPLHLGSMRFIQVQWILKEDTYGIDRA